MMPEEAYELIALCLDYDKGMSEHPERYEMTLRIAREVFQKQVPMKPVYDYQYDEMSCSVCGSLIGEWKERPNYCTHCGHAIDWED